MVLLVALGLWVDGSGRREILDGELAEGETQPDWRHLLDRLWERGVRPVAGLQAIIRDGKGELGAAVTLVDDTCVIEHRCVFHKLRNVADKAREDLSGEARRKSRMQLLDQARSLYQAETAAQARERLNAFASPWGEQVPKAVAALQRDFEQTIAFYWLGGIARQLVRTTSLLECTNRELRRKFRQACCFSSCCGALVAIYLQVQCLHARWTQTSWPQTARALSLAFY